MNQPHNPPVDIRTCVHSMFAERPTLRQVAAQQLMNIIRARYPSISGLTTAEALLLRMPDGLARPLVEVVLQAMLDGRALDFSGTGGVEYSFLLAPEESEGVEPKALNASFNQLLPMLPEHFYQAQIAFWSGGEAIERDVWLQQMLRIGLFVGQRRSTLDVAERSCLQDVLLGRLGGITVQAVRVHMQAGPTRYSEILPDLLITASDEVRTITLFCAPDGQVQRFDSRYAWAHALQRRMSQRFAFDSMSWDLFDSDGDAFAVQSALLLECLLADVARLRRSRIASVAQLEQLYAQASEPSRFFAALAPQVDGLPGVMLPSKFVKAEQPVQVALTKAMIDLAVLQSQFKPEDARLAIEDLHTYAARRLREEMLADYPIEANYFADDLLLTVDTFAIDPGGLGFSQKIDSKTLTLTELAIGRLKATGEGVVTHIGHREGQLIMGWMNVDYLRRLVSRVDIGANYPVYVHGLLDDEALREQRITSFAGHWRLSLLFDAIRARVLGQLGEASYEVLGHFCRQGNDASAGVRIAPLAFKRSPTSHLVDRVHGMFVIELTGLPGLLLYCPLYPNKLAQFRDAKALLGAICEPGNLQRAILAWFEQTERAIYDNGGFEEPHLPHWPLDPYNPPDKPAPAELLLDYWEKDLDAHLFGARQALLLETADRNTLSNSQVRWGLLSSFTWGLFNVATPLLPGPVAAAVWLYPAIEGVIADLDDLAAGGEAMIEGIVDVLGNSLMALIHLQLPAQPPVAHSLPSLQHLLDALPAADGPPVRLLPTFLQGETAQLASLQGKAETLLDYTWRGAGGINGLSPAQRDRLRQLAVTVSLAGLSPVPSGPAAGLYQQGEHYYVALGGDAYEVQVEDGGARIVGADNTFGPGLVAEPGAWRIKSGLFGGSGRGAGERLLRKLERRVMEQLKALDDHMVSIEQKLKDDSALSAELDTLRASLGKLQSLLDQPPPAEPDARARFDTLHTLYSDRKTELEARQLTKRKQQLELAQQLEQHNLGAERALTALRDNPSYIPPHRRAAWEHETLVRVRQNLIAYETFIIDEVIELGRFREYDTALAAYHNAPEQQKALYYERSREVLTHVVREQLTVIEASTQLDRLVVLSDGELRIPYRGSTIPLNELILKRQLSTVAYRFIQAMYLVELSFAWRSSSKQRFLLFRQVLASQHLRVAGSTHALWCHTNLPLADRIELLETAWDTYAASWLSAQRLKGLGSEEFDVERLGAYQEQLQHLKALAGDSLVVAIREQLEPQAGVSARRLYADKDLQVAHAQDGQIVLGAEKTIDGQAQLQLSDPLGDMILEFHRDQGKWVETVAIEEKQPQVSLAVADPVAVSTATRLLEGNAQVIEAAQGMVNEQGNDKGLIDLLQGQVNDLERHVQLLHGATGTAALVQRLRDAVTTLRSKQVELLTKLYQVTPYPGARALRFMHEHGLIEVDYVGPRRADSSGYLDEYQIRLKAKPGSKGRRLWAAHFHFADAQAAATEFDKGHLKLWGQRQLGYKDQIEAAQAGEVLSIYRGNLTLAEARGIIPF